MDDSIPIKGFNLTNCINNRSSNKRRKHSNIHILLENDALDNPRRGYVDHSVYCVQTHIDNRRVTACTNINIKIKQYKLKITKIIHI